MQCESASPKSDARDLIFTCSASPDWLLAHYHDQVEDGRDHVPTTDPITGRNGSLFNRWMAYVVDDPSAVDGPSDSIVIRDHSGRVIGFRVVDSGDTRSLPTVVPSVIYVHILCSELLYKRKTQVDTRAHAFPMVAERIRVSFAHVFHALFDSVLIGNHRLSACISWYKHRYQVHPYLFVNGREQVCGNRPKQVWRMVVQQPCHDRACIRRLSQSVTSYRINSFSRGRN